MSCPFGRTAAELEDQIADFFDADDITTFREGQYADNIRQLYMELMAMNVGSRNVEKIIRYKYIIIMVNIYKLHTIMYAILTN